MSADGNGIVGLMWYCRYATLLSKFEQYWPLIQHMYFFVKKYEAMGYVDPDHVITFPPEHWQGGRKLYGEVRNVLEKDMTSEEFTSFFEHVKKMTNQLLGAGEQYLSESGVVPHLLRSYTTRTLDMFKGLPQSIWEDIRMQLIYRWKFREPLEYSIVPYAPTSVANKFRF